MEFIIIAITCILMLAIFKNIFGYNVKKLKQVTENEELDKITKKYPDNIELCKEYLKKLENEKVKIEENKEAETSLYIALTDKIIIANVRNSFSRIQTIAHECLHSIQNRKMLIFNFIYSNICIIYFLAITILVILKILPDEMMFLVILILLEMGYCTLRNFLENDAMIKARYLAKEYMEEKQISSKEEIEKIVEGFDKINDIGIKCVNYNLYFNSILKILIFSLLCSIG